LAKDSSLEFLRTLRFSLKTLRWLVLIVLWIPMLMFLADFLIDLLFVATSPVQEMQVVQFIESITHPVSETLTKIVRFNTVVKGYETMPAIIAVVLYVAAALVSGQIKKMVGKVDAQYQRRFVEYRRQPKKAVEAEGLAFSSEGGGKGRGLLSTLLHPKEAERDKLLRDFAEARKRLEKSRQRLAFLSTDIVGSSRIKVGQDPLLAEKLFREYRRFIEEIVKKYRHKASSWTPDGVMTCFPQLELATGAARELLKNLPAFNKEKNPLEFPVQVRCGANMGEVFYDEHTPLEMLSDPVLDLTGHLQKSAAPNSLLITADSYEQLRDKTGYNPAPFDVDGLMVYEWSLEARRPASVAGTGTGTRLGRTVTGTGGRSVTGTGTRTITGSGPQAARPAFGAMEGEGENRIGRYEIVEELGRGAMGAVYKARDPQIGRTVAIKVVLTANLSESELNEYKQRFYREAQAAGQMSHPNIVTIHDIAEDASGHPFLVMEFIEGTTLERLLAPGSERLPFAQSLDIAVQVASALDYAHARGVIHRDIKPANILLTNDGRAKLTDFGIAKLAGSQLTQVGQVMGTPAFMSPEQFTGAAVDSRTDIFSLGAVLYWVLTGEKPFPGDTITAIIFKMLHSNPVPARQLNPALPAEIEPVLAKCLTKSPDERYQKAAELAAALDALKGKRPEPTESLTDRTIISGG
jgi:class 3 adenylate cyclase/tRNA A-37 threonylcarbamoyl transferase component Bud32